MILVVNPIGTDIKNRQACTLEGDKSLNLIDSYVQIPKSQDYNSTSSEFYANEECFRSFNWTEMNRTDISDVNYATPPNYNYTTANVTFQVMSEPVTTDIVNNTGGDHIKNELAQAFNISTTSYLTGISIYSGGNKETNVGMQIRNSTYDGIVIRSFSADLIDGWVNVTFTPEIYLTAGKYFVWMAMNSSPSLKQWYSTPSGVNNTETWEKISGVWTRPDYDMTLKIKTSSLINPEDINMMCGGKPVQYGLLGRGYVNSIKKSINGDNITFETNSSTPALYSYSVNAIYSRSSKIDYNYTIDKTTYNPVPKWTLSLNLNNPSPDYKNYQVNISGFRTDYYDIQVFNGTTQISYSRPNPDTIILDNVADSIQFNSPNYVSSVNIPTDLYLGGVFPINISVNQIGTVTLDILDNGTMIYSNTSMISSSSVFLWNIPLQSNIIDPNNISILVKYYGDNELGYFEKTTSLKMIGIITASPITAYAFDPILIQCRYSDYYQNAPIENAIINYSVLNIGGSLKYDNSTNYSQVLDANIYSLKPGNYTIDFNAEKQNYKSDSATTSLTINYRPVDIVLTRSSSYMHPGEQMKFYILISDKITGTSLSRPVNIKFYVKNSNTSITNETVFLRTFTGVTNEFVYTWDIPNHIALGEYDIFTEIQSDYYTGVLYIANAILVSSKPIIWVYIVLPSIAAVIGTSFYVREKKHRTKRSVKGMIILHENGIPMAERISTDFTKTDHSLISSAVTGMISIIKEITGNNLRTIEIKDGFVNIIKGDLFWLILFLRRNPKWIKRSIRKCADKIGKKYGRFFAHYTGQLVKIPIDKILQQSFGVKIKGSTYEKLESQKAEKKPDTIFIEDA